MSKSTVKSVITDDYSEFLTELDSIIHDRVLEECLDKIPHDEVDREGKPLHFHDLIFLLKVSPFRQPVRLALPYASFDGRNGKIPARKKALPGLKKMIRMILDKFDVKASDEWIEGQIRDYEDKVAELD